MKLFKLTIFVLILASASSFYSQQRIGVEMGTHVQRLEDFERGSAFYNHKIGLNQARIFKVVLDYSIQNPLNLWKGLIIGTLVEGDSRKSLEINGSAAYLGIGLFAGIQTGEKSGFIGRLSLVDQFIINDNNYYYSYEKTSPSVLFLRTSFGGYKRFKDKLEGGILINYQRDLSSRYSYVYQPHVPGLNSKYVAFAHELYVSVQFKYLIK